jgi:hypothetical protein
MCTTAQSGCRARRIGIAIAMLNAVLGISLSAREAGQHLGFSQASSGRSPGWAIYVTIRLVNTHAYAGGWGWNNKSPNVVRVSMVHLNISRPSFMWARTLDVPFRALAACTGSAALALLAFVTMSLRCWPRSRT